MGVSTCAQCGSPLVYPHVCATGLTNATGPIPPDSGLSFMDRYSGTEWDTSPRMPVAPPARHKRGGGRSVLLVLGVISLVAAAIGATLAFATAPPRAPVSALVPSPSPEGETTSPSAPPPTAAADATLPATPPAVTPPPVASQTPDREPSPRPIADGPAGAFAALMVDHDSSYAVVCSGTIAIGNQVLTVQVDMKVSGEDLEGTSVIGHDRERAIVSVIVKNGVHYVRPAGEGWHRSETEVGLPGDAFGNTPPSSWSALEDVGEVNRGGRRLHLLRVPSLDWKALSEALFTDADGGGFTIRELKFDVWVTQEGEPQVAELSFDGTGTANGLEVDVTYFLTYRFSRFGEDMQIVAPRTDGDPGQITS